MRGGVTELRRTIWRSALCNSSRTASSTTTQMAASATMCTRPNVRTASRRAIPTQVHRLGGGGRKRANPTVVLQIIIYEPPSNVNASLTPPGILTNKAVELLRSRRLALLSTVGAMWRRKKGSRLGAPGSHFVPAGESGDSGDGVCGEEAMHGGQAGARKPPRCACRRAPRPISPLEASGPHARLSVRSACMLGVVMSSGRV